MVQGKKPDGPGGDPSIVIIKLKRPAYPNWNPGGFGAVELPAGALPVSNPGCRWQKWLGGTGKPKPFIYICE